MSWDFELHGPSQAGGLWPPHHERPRRPRHSQALPDTVHRAVRPGTALLRLDTTHTREGILDGAWWSRSRGIGAELPALITALTGHLGPDLRVGMTKASTGGQHRSPRAVTHRRP
ncbi:DUF5994 family protein [Streptomyces mexicanus]|uniref:DUF5994 family protein n=1 Tax=Streptomyces mexicanus TaxID=178566 RepID=UPI00336F5B03